MKTVEIFLAETKAKCEATAKRMAKLELSVWDNQHETDLVSDFGFTKKTVSERKNQLLDIAS